MNRPLALALSSATLLAGCGQPATAEQCEEIVERIARLELAARKVPPQELEAEVKATKAKVASEALMRDCVGKRITESTLRCIREASQSETIFDQCL